MMLLRLLFLVVVSLLVFSASGRRLSRDTTSTCRSIGVIRIRITDGSCSGHVSSSCATIAEAEDDMKETSSLFLDRDVCEEESISAFSNATATIVAKVFTNAFVKIQCTGQGSGCGWTLSSGDAVAADLAKALSQSVVSAIDEKGKSLPICVADIDALATGFASAASASQAFACQKGPGIATDFEDSFIESITVAVAKAFTSALSIACEGDTEGSECDIKVDGDTGITSTFQFSGTGTASAAGGRLSTCKDSYAACCNDSKLCKDASLSLHGPDETGSYAVHDIDAAIPSCVC